MAADQQKNVAVNMLRQLVFFEGTDTCYNYKTNQWTRIPAYANLQYYSVNDKDATIGLVRFSSGSVDIQKQVNTYVVQTATIETAAPNINAGGRAVITNIRPISNGGTYAVRVGVQDKPSDSVSYSASTSINTRSGQANFRSEGRYLRAEFVITGGFTTAMGADIEYAEQGRI